MKKELDDLLCRRYPEIFLDRHALTSPTCMSQGFSCGDGWFALIDTLCSAIQKHCEQTGQPIPVARQVKEKFGTLRFYLRGSDEYVEGLRWMAEDLSAWICEECGASGRLLNTRRCLGCRCREHWGDPSQEYYQEPPATGDCNDGDLCGSKGRSYRPINLPSIVSPSWQRLAQELKRCLDWGMHWNEMPQIWITCVRETDRLTFQWNGGDDEGCAAGMIRMVEDYSFQLNPLTGKPRTNIEFFRS